jgi:hypothetical protein
MQAAAKRDQPTVKNHGLEPEKVRPIRQEAGAHQQGLALQIPL